MFFACAGSAHAQAFCTREARVDCLGHDEGRCSLKREAGGRTLRGEAWFERCGPDGIRHLVAGFRIEPDLELDGHASADGDNAYRVTFTTGRHAHGGEGLDPWFQPL